jgi:hypothetical protein
MVTFKIIAEEFESMANYATARDLFPTFSIDQESMAVTISTWSVSNQKRGQWGKTHECDVVASTDGQVLRISGFCGLRNDRRGTGGQQKFCYFIFVGDSGHLYCHRSVASKGWLECGPDLLLKKLVKAGIGTAKNVIQQGDFLLKPANGSSYLDSDFQHESMGAGHHNFICPVLYADGSKGRQYWVKEPVLLVHTATDGIKHPDQDIPVGKWIVGTTKESLRHENKRD